MKLTLKQVAEWMHAKGEFAANAEATGTSIDSRTIAAGELFFAVRGEHFDGHDFVQAALAKDAVAAVVRAGWNAPDGTDASRLLRVRETEVDCVLEALQRLALMVRRHWGRRVIGVTGSAGKTTTKDAVAQVLGSRFRVLKSQGNLNNAFGLPLQLLRLEAEDEVAVIEMGMNHSGEITALAHVAEPDWGVVTNVAPVHLEHFADGIAGIARAKYELIEALPPDGIAVLNCDDTYVTKFGDGMGGRAVFYGTGECAEVRAVQITELGSEGVLFTVTAQGERASVQLHLLGRHNVHNALAAIAVGLRSGIPLAECAAALGELRAGDKRGEVFEWCGVKCINDCYNSNPRALDAMVDALLAMPVAHEGRHIVVAGEMLELGPAGEEMHRACGRRMAERGVDVVVGVRGLAAALVEGAAATEAHFVETPEEAGAWLRENLRPGDAVLLKASRGVKLERALASLTD
ncbi:MAG TPA: UDP-N-acetylmuramoyl-tripeptide--D-alanyl-D-alanine ligase [Acidobacteriaceae bacterium]|nr:UDP-N-acetylmuramoyl-tripeptide--D-alanyl-D-alanine ligase [Acidobacteriaceae bacterium]